MKKEKSEPVNLLTDEECERIAELSKRPDLNLKFCGHSFRYFGLTKKEREAVKEDIEYLETTLRKWCPDLVSFSNFTGSEPNAIRIQSRYGPNFVGVQYLPMPSNEPVVESTAYEIVDKNDDVMYGFKGLTLKQAADTLDALIADGEDARVKITE